MKAKFEESLKQLVRDTPWCEHMGGDLSQDGFILIRDVQTANKMLKSETWEDITLEASNKISSYLEQNFTHIAESWNDLASEAREFLNTEILPNLPEFSSIEHETLRADIGWNVLHFMLEIHYKKFLNNHDFFAKIFKIYQTGHIAVGYDTQNDSFLAY